MLLKHSYTFGNRVGSHLWQAICSAWRCLRHVPSPPARGAWIETSALASPYARLTSPPARGAWIETTILPRSRCHDSAVAPRAGGVD